MSNFDSADNVGVFKSSMSDFYEDLKARLLLITGLEQMPRAMQNMTDDQRRTVLFHPMMALALPGVGKTAGIISIVKELNELLAQRGESMGFKKIQLGQTTVGELAGIPVVVNGNVKRVTQEDLPDEERDGKYGVLFLDELTTADEMQMQPALGLADGSRSLGVYKLPENWFVVAAGNGPECSNFVRLDDAVLSRFSVYDIEYDYKKDWRPWAHANNINELIIAFLNFDSSWIVKPQSTDMDKCGKQFPTPRSWESLSGILAMRVRPMSNAQLKAVASREIGREAAEAFASFAMFKEKLEEVDDKIVEHIFDGSIIEKARKEGKSPTEGMPQETFSIILQMLVAEIKLLLKNDAPDAMDISEYSEDTLVKVGRSYTYILSYQNTSLDAVIGAFTEVNTSVPDIAAIITDTDVFCTYCPELDEFFDNYADVISDTNMDVSAMGI